MTNQFGSLKGSLLDLQQDTLEQTGNPLDFAIEGPGFSPSRPMRELSTRATEAFGCQQAASWFSPAGDPVLGQSGAITVSGGPVAISFDGTVSVKGAVAGKLRIVEFAHADGVTPAGSSLLFRPRSWAHGAILRRFR